MNQEKEKLFIEMGWIVFLNLFLILSSCVSNHNAEIEIGKPIPDGINWKKSEPISLLISPASFGEAYEVKYKGFAYNVVLSKSGNVEYVSTSDPNFKTSNGISTGQTYNMVKNKLKSQWAEPGFAYCAISGSKWIIGFFDNYFLETRQIADTSKVVFLFKSINRQ